MCSAKVYTFINPNSTKNEVEHISSNENCNNLRSVKRLNEIFESTNQVNVEDSFEEIIKELRNISRLKNALEKELKGLSIKSEVA